MPPSRPVRDNRLLDALEALRQEPFSGTLWRIVRTGRDPCTCSASGGRWDDRTFDVLYTSQAAEGAKAEMYFHLTRGQPVMPSAVTYSLHELSVTLNSCINFPTLEELSQVGLDVTNYGQLNYAEKAVEYPRSQEIAEYAYFLGCDGLIVPSARWKCQNVIVFCDHVDPDRLTEVRDHGPIDLD